MVNESIIMDDLVILGRACPELIRDGRITVCTAGYSEKYGFVRVYPTTLYMPWKQWDVVSVPLERNPHDNRKESWKIQGSKKEWDTLHNKISIVDKLTNKKERAHLVSNLVDGCVSNINQDKRSLGIVKPHIKKCFFTKIDDYDSTNQIDLSGLPLPKVKDQYSIQPRISYRCGECTTKKNHDQQVLEWGFYEWIRKNPNNPEQVWDNAQINSDKHEIYFFLGNHFVHRRSFFIISVLRLPKTPAQQTLTPLKKVSDDI